MLRATNLTEYNAREICDVTFKALTNNQKVGNKEFKAGQVVFVIDTATTSNMEQASTTVYAQGGKGYNRLIAWDCFNTGSGIFVRR